MSLKAKDLISDKMPYASTLLKLKELTFYDDKPHVIRHIRRIEALRHPQIPSKKRLTQYLSENKRLTGSLAPLFFAEPSKLLPARDLSVPPDGPWAARRSAFR